MVGWPEACWELANLQRQHVLPAARFDLRGKIELGGQSFEPIQKPFRGFIGFALSGTPGNDLPAAFFAKALHGFKDW